MKKAIFITVRIDSSRLPNKAIKEILGVPVIELVIKRAKVAKDFDEVIVCTTDRKIDDQIAAIAEKNKVGIFRGSVEDKLDRWLKAAEKYDVDAFVTMDGDDLFCEPYLLSLGIEQLQSRELDFIETSKDLPIGAFTYGLKVSALRCVCEMKGTSDTEMMWTYFKDTNKFKTGELIITDERYFDNTLRLTLDYQEDFEMFTKVFDAFQCTNNDISLVKIIEYLHQHPEVSQINIGRQQDFLENQKKKTKLILK